MLVAPSLCHLITRAAPSTCGHPKSNFLSVISDAALVLMYLEEMSGDEMAEILGISEENIRVRLSRARKSLRDLMKEVVHEP